MEQRLAETEQTLEGFGMRVDEVQRGKTLASMQAHKFAESASHYRDLLNEAEIASVQQRAHESALRSQNEELRHELQQRTIATAKIEEVSAELFEVATENQVLRAQVLSLLHDRPDSEVIAEMAEATESIRAVAHETAQSEKRAHDNLLLEHERFR